MFLLNIHNNLRPFKAIKWEKMLGNSEQQIILMSTGKLLL